MARRTPLYEMMNRSRRTPRPEVAPTPEDAGDGFDWTAIAAWMTPGRVLRVPVGYVLVAGVVLFLVVLAAYMVGFKRAEIAYRKAHEQGILDRARVAAPEQVGRDPLMNPIGRSEPPTDQVELRAAPPALASPDRPVTGPGDLPGGTMGPLRSDPRVAGKLYFVVAETRESGAVRLAEFFRENDLAAYVVISNNPRFRRVVLLPGFDTRDRSDPAVKRLQEAILRVGRRWQATERGASDLSDAYMMPYEP